MKEGWEYKKLGDIGTFIRGGNFSKKDFVEDGFPCIHYGQIHMKFGVETLRNISSVPAEMVKNDRCAKKGDLVIAITSEDDAGSCKCTAWMGDYDVYVGGHTAIYRHKMQPKYVSYYFMSPFFQKDKLEYTHGFKVVEISPKDIAKITIPVPSLSEQQSIVDYLDSAFAKIDAMKANAEKALNEAKALFQASLKEMLEPKEGWEEKTLGDIATDMYRGSGIRRDQVTKEGTPCVRYGEIYTTYNVGFDTCVSHTKEEYISSPKYFEHGDLLFAITGESVEDIGKTIAYLGNEKCLCGGDIICMKHNQNPKFLAYALTTPEAIRQKGMGKTKLKVVHTNAPALKGIIIPVPPLSVQQSIVATLDSLKSKVDRLQANYDKISQECDALKQAILRQVFE